MDLGETGNRIFWGILSEISGVPDPFAFSLEDYPQSIFPGHFGFVAVFYSTFDELDFGRVGELARGRTRVSIFGQIGESVTTQFERVPSIRAQKIVAQAAVEAQAFQIYKSDGGLSSIDNWLLAERELLGMLQASAAVLG
jgi:hypothetical protein